LELAKHNLYGRSTIPHTAESVICQPPLRLAHEVFHLISCPSLPGARTSVATLFAALLLVGAAGSAAALTIDSFTVTEGGSVADLLGHPGGDTYNVEYSEDLIDQQEGETCTYDGNVSRSSTQLVSVSCNDGSHSTTIGPSDYGEEETSSYQVKVTVSNTDETVAETNATVFSLDTMAPRVSWVQADVDADGSQEPVQNITESDGYNRTAPEIAWFQSYDDQHTLNVTIGEQFLNTSDTLGPRLHYAAESGTPSTGDSSGDSRNLSDTGLGWEDDLTAVARQVPATNQGDIFEVILQADDDFRTTVEPSLSNGSVDKVYAFGLDGQDPQVDSPIRVTGSTFEHTRNGTTWRSGTLTMEVDASENNSRVEKVEFTRDDNATPFETNTSPTSGSTLDGTWQVSEGSDAAPDNFTDGQHTLKATVVDGAGNRNATNAAQETVVHVDNAAPSVSLVTDPADIGPAQETLTWNITDHRAGLNASTLNLTRNGTGVEILDANVTANATELEFTYQPSDGLAQGTYTYQVTIADELQNQATPSYDVDVDFTDPLINQLNVTLADGQDYNSSSDLSHVKSGTHWVTGDSLEYVVDTTDSLSGVASAPFFEDDTRRNGSQVGPGPFWKWSTNESGSVFVDGADEESFTLGVNVSDEVENWNRSKGSQNISLGFDRQRPSASLASSQVEFVGQPSIVFDIDDEGSGINESTVDLERRDPGESSFSPTANTTAHISTTTLRVTHDPPSVLDNGTYGFRVTGDDNLTQSVNETFTIDVVDANITRDSRVAQRGGLAVELNATNASRLVSASFRWFEERSSSPATQVGSSSEWSEAFPDINEAPGTVQVYNFATAGDVELGNYDLEATLETPLGTATKRIPVRDTVNITPKLTLEHQADAQDRQPNGPWLEGGELNASIWAAYHDTTGPAGSSCSDNVCPVSEVVVEGKFETDGGGEEWRVIDTAPTPRSETGFEWLNYTIDTPVSDLASFQDVVRISSNVSLGSGPSENHESTESFIVEGPGAGVLTPQLPEVGTVNKTGNVSFAAEVGSVPDSVEDPEVQLTVTNATGAEVIGDEAMNSPGGNEEGVWRLNATEVGSKLDSSAYTAKYSLVDLADGGSEADAFRDFRVQRSDPAVVHVDAPGNIVGGATGTRWIGSSFGLNVTVDTGFARLPSLDNVTVAFNPTDGPWQSSPNVTWDNASAGDAVVVDDLGRATYHLSGEAEAPSSLDHGDTFTLWTNATSSATGTDPSDPQEDGVGTNDLIGVKLDGLAPNVSAHRTFTEVLGTFTHNESLTTDADADAQLKLNVSDEGAELGGVEGPGGVDVTFFNRSEHTGNVTFHPWTGSGFGDTGAEARPFSLAPLDTDVWALNYTNASGIFDEIRGDLDTYFVNVSATDRAENVGNLTRLSIAADLGAPQIASENVSQSADGENFTTDAVTTNFGNASQFSSKDDGRIRVRVTVTEDTSLEGLAALLRKPNGDVATAAANLSRAATCSNLDSTTKECTFNVTGAALNRVGTYRMGVVANDTVGNVGDTTNATDGSRFLLNFTVRDTIPPSDLSTTIEPSAVGPETNVKASVTAFDDSGVAAANATWVNTTGDEEVRAATVSVTDCSPTANTSDDPRRVRCQARSDDAGIDFGVGDTWRVDWKVFDVVGRNRTTQSAEFDILESGSPLLTQVEPPAGSTFISSSGQLGIEIEGPSLKSPPEDSVEVEVTDDSGNFTTYPESNWNIESAGNSTSLLNITPPSGSTGDSVDLRVNVTSAAGESEVQTYSFTLDNDAPQVTLGVDTTSADGSEWVAPDAEFTVDASDADSGVGSLAYSVDDGNLQSTEGTFTLPSSASGTVTVEAQATDAAGNTATDSQTVTIDDGPPSVTIDNLARTVTATVNDGGIGLDASNVNLLYREGDPGSYSSTTMSNTQGTTWEASVPQDVQGQICVVVEAQDQLGTTGRSRSQDNPRCFGSQNSPPTLQITDPASGATVKESLTVEWSASDPDGDSLSLSFSVVRRDGSSPPQTLDSGVENTGSATFDVSGLDDGNYTLNVRVSDGAQSDQATRPIAILNQDVVQAQKVPGQSSPVQEPVEVEVQVSHPFKQVQEVTGVVTRNGDVVAEEPMENTEGNTYKLSYTPEEPGAYNVSVRVSYADDTSESFDVAGFDVAGSVDRGLAAQLVALVILGAVVVGMGGYGAFGRWDR
jgi:hypothetical protein